MNDTETQSSGARRKAVGGRPGFSWRGDETVPEFDDTKTVLVMDRDCALCSTAARMIARRDRADEIRIATVQSALGTSLLRHFNLDPKDPRTWLMLSNGRALTSLDAVIELWSGLHPAFRVLRALYVLPRPTRDWIYARIARNRYAMFGHADMCAMPDPELRRRLL